MIILFIPQACTDSKKTGCVERQRLLQYLLRAECGSQGERKYIVGMVNTHVDLLSFDLCIVSKKKYNKILYYIIFFLLFFYNKPIHCKSIKN